MASYQTGNYFLCWRWWWATTLKCVNFCRFCKYLFFIRPNRTNNCSRLSTRQSWKQIKMAMGSWASKSSRRWCQIQSAFIAVALLVVAHPLLRAGYCEANDIRRSLLTGWISVQSSFWPPCSLHASVTRTVPSRYMWLPCSSTHPCRYIFLIHFVPHIQCKHCNALCKKLHKGWWYKLSISFCSWTPSGEYKFRPCCLHLYAIHAML